MDRANWEQQQQLEDERLCKTIEALDEIYGCGMYETAEFFARELGVTNWWKPERTKNEQIQPY